MESGLLRLVVALLIRMSKKTGEKKVAPLAEYALNNTDAWDFARLPGEKLQDAIVAEADWNRHVASLDTAILSLLSEGDVADADLEKTIDAVLKSSLFERRIAHRDESQHAAYRAILLGRAKYIWGNSTAKQRRGYFLSGVGFTTGKALDANAAALNQLLVDANGAILNREDDEAISAITAFAEIVFEIPPFRPDPLPTNWKIILKAWLEGKALNALAAGDQDAVLRFVEQGLVYHLPWAMESVRVRGIANNDHLEKLLVLTMDDFELSLAVGAVETGSLDQRAALLMRTGFSSRSAAIKVINDIDPDIDSTQELRGWLRGREMREATQNAAFPTPETHRLWTEYVGSFARSSSAKWSTEKEVCAVSWFADAPEEGIAVRLVDDGDEGTVVMDATFERLGTIDRYMNPARCGLMKATVDDGNNLAIEYLGPGDLWASE
jgi:hypothetical protein